MEKARSVRRGKRADSRDLTHFVEDTFAMLQVKVRSHHSHRALVYQVSEDLMRYPFDRCNLFKTEAAEATPKDAPKPNRWEHIVPRGLVLVELLGKEGVPQIPLSMERFQRAFELFRIVCKVTATERALIDNRSPHITGDEEWHGKIAMPPGWDFMTGDPWDRMLKVQAILAREPAGPQLSPWSPLTRN